MKEIRLDIAGTTYREDVIVSLSTHRELFSGAPSVGNCVSGELNATLTVSTSDIPRNAEIVPYIREDGGEWVQKSRFFVFSREVDKVTGWVSIVAYDAIFRASAYFANAGDQGQWPRTDITVMQQIATRTGAAINAETVTAMNKAYPVQYPGIVLESGSKKIDGSGALTMRDVAGRIASYYGGNWIIDNNGEWRLILFGDIPADADYLITENTEIIVMGGVRILVR